MKKFIYLILFAFVAMMPASLVSCSETDNEDKEFADWQERNDTYFKSIYTQAKQAIANGDTSWKIIRGYSKSDTTTNINHFVVAKVITEGTSTTACPVFTDSVKIHYRGNLMPTVSYPNGYQFDSSWTGDYDIKTMSPVTGNVNGYIYGFSTALQKMHDGDRWKIYIPYALGYNAQENTGIPAYSTLVFDLTLVKSFKKRI